LKKKECPWEKIGNRRGVGNQKKGCGVWGVGKIKKEKGSASIGKSAFRRKEEGGQQGRHAGGPGKIQITRKKTGNK